MKQTDVISDTMVSIAAVMSEDDIDPMVAMTAMLQLAAKISYDAGMQDGLSEEDNKSRWMGGAMLAFDTMCGGQMDVPANPPQRRHLFLCPGVGEGAKHGFKHRMRKTRRTNRKR